MKFFIDTANLEQIRKAHELGVLDGVTGVRKTATVIMLKSATSSKGT